MWGATVYALPPVVFERFQSTLPVWGATYIPYEKIGDQKFQSTLPVWGATRDERLDAAVVRDFNPRSPCGERPVRDSPIWPYWNFNPRSPCGERRFICSREKASADFNPRSPCGERPRAAWVHFVDITISIHAPRVGSDLDAMRAANAIFAFQSTLPVWGATRFSNSIAGADSNFNPRSPCGERRSIRRKPSDFLYFNPRSPCGERLLRITRPEFVNVISIHAPRVGSDAYALIGSTCEKVFQSTLPVWGATWCARRAAGFRADFNPRSPCGERLNRSDSAA